MAEFFEKTWFIWWILANLAVLRWFHIMCSSQAETEPDRESEEPYASRNMSYRRSSG